MKRFYKKKRERRTGNIRAAVLFLYKKNLFLIEKHMKEKIRNNRGFSDKDFEKYVVCN